MLQNLQQLGALGVPHGITWLLFGSEPGGAFLLCAFVKCKRGIDEIYGWKFIRRWTRWGDGWIFCYVRAGEFSNLPSFPVLTAVVVV